MLPDYKNKDERQPTIKINTETLGKKEKKQGKTGRFLKLLEIPNFKLTISHHEEKANSLFFRKTWDRFPSRQKYSSGILTNIQIFYHYHAFFFFKSLRFYQEQHALLKHHLYWSCFVRTQIQNWYPGMVLPSDWLLATFIYSLPNRTVHACWQDIMASKTELQTWEPKETKPLPRQWEPHVRFVAWK